MVTLQIQGHIIEAAVTTMMMIAKHALIGVRQSIVLAERIHLQSMRPTAAREHAITVETATDPVVKITLADTTTHRPGTTITLHPGITTTLHPEMITTAILAGKIATPAGMISTTLQAIATAPRVMIIVLLGMSAGILVKMFIIGPAETTEIFPEMSIALPKARDARFILH